MDDANKDSHVNNVINTRMNDKSLQPFTHIIVSNVGPLKEVDI